MVIIYKENGQKNAARLRKHLTNIGVRFIINVSKAFERNRVPRWKHPERRTFC